MLYDLSIAWSPSSKEEDLIQTLSLAAFLGYQTVALNYALAGLPQTSLTSPFPPAPTTTSPSAKLPHILHRATLPMSDPSAPTFSLPALMQIYDILAVRPTTREAFQNACINMDIPIISLDLTQHLNFHFHPKPCMAAVSRGVRFEICYGQALTADSRGRANFIGNATGLIRATKGRGLFISSETSNAMGLRAPADVANLLSVWGLPSNKAMNGLGSIPRSIVVNEGMKRNGFRGVIEIVQVIDKPKPLAKKGEQEAGEAGAEGKSGGNEDSRKSKGRRNGKRKMAQNNNPEQGKQHAKKMKVALQKNEQEAG